MNKRSGDYIPYGFEIEAAREEAASRAASTADPRHKYVIEYVINSMPMTQTVHAMNAKEAEEILKHECGMVGWIPQNINIKTND